MLLVVVGRVGTSSPKVWTSVHKVNLVGKECRLWEGSVCVICVSGVTCNTREDKSALMCE